MAETRQVPQEKTSLIFKTAHYPALNARDALDFNLNVHLFTLKIPVQARKLGVEVEAC